jgi:hypothetical protein
VDLKNKKKTPVYAKIKNQELNLSALLTVNAHLVNAKIGILKKESNSKVYMLNLSMKLKDLDFSHQI